MRAHTSASRRNSARRIVSCGAGLVLQGIAVPALCVEALDAADASGVDEIITTGVREAPLAKVPRSASLITSGDIALATATNLVELLSTQANLSLRSVSGNEKFSGIDIRGQGDTYTSNVLLLLDGVSVNESDLSGADYSLISLGQIDRVEVLRGPNTVRYGNGAVAGVINIITRKPEPGIGVNARTRYGSYSTTDSGLGLAWASEQLWVSADAAYFDSDGYRDNSDLEKKDLLLKTGYAPSESLELSVSGSWHEDTYGLPGPVDEEAFNGSSNDRETTAFPFDGGETDDDRLRGDVRLGNEATGLLTLRGVTRNRTNDFRIGEQFPDQPFDRIAEDTDTLFAQYEYDLNWLGREHSFFAGFESGDTDYSRTQPAEAGNQNNLGDIRQSAWFAAADIALSKDLTLSAGYRQDSFQLDSRNDQFSDSLCDDSELIGTPPNQLLVCNDPGGFRSGFEQGVTERNSWRNSALEISLVYTPQPAASFFLAYAQAFRNPNVDELIFAEEGLSPQTSDHWEAGLRGVWGKALEYRLAAFYSETDDEILFSLGEQAGGVLLPLNINADEQIERKGGELELRWFALPTLQLNSNVGYTRAQFKDSKNDLPLVPRWTAAVTSLWQPLPDWTVTVTANFVDDERYDGNDFTNSEDQLDSYGVVDAKVSYDMQGLQLFAGVNNLFNKVYATSVYSRNFYPLPDTNYYVGVAYQM